MKGKTNTFKRMLSLFLSFVMMFSVMAISVSAAEPDLHTWDEYIDPDGEEVIAIVGSPVNVDYRDIVDGGKLKIQYKFYVNPNKASGINILPVTMQGKVDGVKYFEALGTLDMFYGEETPDLMLNTDTDSFLIRAKNPANGRYNLPVKNIYYNDDKESGYIGDIVIEYTIEESKAARLKSLMETSNGTYKLDGLLADASQGRLNNDYYDENGNRVEKVGAQYVKLVSPTLKTTKTSLVNFVTNLDAEGNEIPFDITTTGIPTEEVRVPVGGDYPIPEITATYTDDTVDPAMKYVLKNWKVTGWTAEEIGKEGTITNMPENDITLTAVYDKDSNGDDIPDSEQVTVKYTIREGDVAGVGQVLVGGKNIKDTDTSYVLDLNAALGTKAASVVPATGEWKLDGFYAKGAEIAATTEALAECKVPGEKGEYPIEIRMIYDKDGDDVDDRLTLTVTVENTDGKAIDVATIENVKQNATYVVKNEKGEVVSDANANVGKDVENGFAIDVTGKAADKKDGKYPFVTWKVTTEKETATDVDGNEVEVVKSITVEPGYSTVADTKEPTFPGPVIDGTDPTNDDDEISEDPKPIEVAGDAFIVFRNEKGEVIEGYGKVDPDDITADYVYPNDKVAAKQDGNPMDAWKLTGITEVEKADPTYGDALPADADFDFPHYFMDPHYVKGQVKVTVNETKNDGTKKTTDLTLPAEGTVEYTGTDGKPVVVEITPADIATGKTIDLPKNEDMPKKNDEGKYFKDEWKVEGPVDTDDPADGIPDKYTLVPVYGEPDDDDIEIVPVIPGDDPDPDDPDKPDGVKANGEGYTVLLGNYAEETTAEVHFYVSVMGIPADGADLDNKIITAKAVGSYGYASVIKERVVTVDYIGEVEAKDGSGKKFGDFVVTWEQGKSRIATITMNYNDKAVNHDVITVSDADKSQSIGMGDTAAIKLILLGQDDEPAAASDIANVADIQYLRELMDVDKSSTIAMGDVAEIKLQLLGVNPKN